jgi:hypothetical protein
VSDCTGFNTLERTLIKPKQAKEEEGQEGIKPKKEK